MNNHRNKTRPEIHIFHNGEVAEFDYFQDFKHFLGARHEGVIIKNYHKRTKGKAPWQLVDEASKLKICAEDGDQIWCVFDIDDFLRDNQEQFRKALAKAQKNKIKIAWSNQCFELWLMLHFEQISTAISNKDYPKKLTALFKKIGVTYKKNSLGIFKELLSKQNAAIRRAKKNFQNNPAQNPSTSIFLLVEELNKFLIEN